MPAMPPCAKAREEAPASTQTTVNAIIEREAGMPNVLLKRGQLMEQAGGEWRKGRRVRLRTNTWRASALPNSLSGQVHSAGPAVGNAWPRRMLAALPAVLERKMMLDY